MISFIIPLYNEQENIPQLINSLIDLKKRKKLDCELVLVNDNSKDSTANLINNYAKKYDFVKPLHRKKGQNGMGYALIDGTRTAKGDIIIWTMGDNSDDINTYEKLIDKINQNYDVVFATRYIKGGSRGDLDRLKALFSSSYTKITSILFGMNLHDITNAFRCFKKEVFNSFIIESGDFAISPEFAIKAHLNKFKMGEIPTVYSNRKKGQSKFKLFKMGIRYISLFKFRFINKKKWKK